MTQIKYIPIWRNIFIQFLFDINTCITSQHLTWPIIVFHITLPLGPIKKRWYSARCLIGSRIIESAAYCNQIMLVPLYLNSTQNTSVNWIIPLLLSVLHWPKVILLSGGHCTFKATHFWVSRINHKLSFVHEWLLGKSISKLQKFYEFALRSFVNFDPKT